MFSSCYAGIFGGLLGVRGLISQPPTSREAESEVGQGKVVNINGLCSAALQEWQSGGYWEVVESKNGCYIE